MNWLPLQAKADKSWRQMHAEQLGIELSDEDEDEDGEALQHCVCCPCLTASAGLQICYSQACSTLSGFRRPVRLHGSRQLPALAARLLPQTRAGRGGGRARRQSGRRPASVARRTQVGGQFHLVSGDGSPKQPALCVLQAGSLGLHCNSLLAAIAQTARPASDYPAAETAAEVRAQLAALLAEPLQPKFSRKWFTGGAAAAVMAAVDPSAPAAAGGKKRKAAQPAAGERGAAAGEEVAPVPEPRTVQTVSQAVALAQQQADSRSRAAGAAGAAGGKQQTQKKAGKKKVHDPRAAALQAALNKALTAKQRKKAGGRGMTVVATALGREASGPDALQALRQKLGGR